MNTGSLSDLQSTALKSIEQLSSLDQLEQFRVEYLGKKGLITAQLKRIGGRPHEQRKRFGNEVNVVRNGVQNAL